MQPLKHNFLDALKQKKVDLDLKRIPNNNSVSATNLHKTSQSSRRDPSPMDTLNNSSTGAASKFRVRTLTSNTITTEENVFSKSTSKLPPRPTTAAKKDTGAKPITSQALLSASSSRLSTMASGGRGTQSSKSLLVKSQSTRMFEDIDTENDINFLNVDDDAEFDEKIREELEIFNDIADLNEVKLADILNVDVDMLPGMTRVEMKVDLSFNSLQYAGEILVSLKQLRLNNSIIPSLRDVGNSFLNLEILWISRCGLKSLAGLSALPKLKELYASYNNIKDLSDIIFHDQLQLLDLEGNEIANLDTLENLINLYSLNNLTVSANPLCKIKGYEKKIMNELLPSLELLNDRTKDEVNAHSRGYDIQDVDADLDQEFDSERDSQRIKDLYDKFEKLHMFSVKEFDETTKQKILNDMVSEPTEEDLILMSVKKSSKKAKANLPEGDDFGKLSIDVSKKKTLTQRPQSSKGRIGSKSGAISLFADTDKFKSIGIAASDLNQTGEAFAGNPLKALRHKRKNQFTSGFETVQGENIAKPKDIMKLIEEFEINDGSEDDEEKKYEEIFSGTVPTESDTDFPQDQGKENKTEGDLDMSQGRAASLTQRESKPVPRIRRFSQGKESGELVNAFSAKDLSIQDIRNQLNSKARVKIQIKTKKPPIPTPVNPLSVGKEVNN